MKLVEVEVEVKESRKDYEAISKLLEK